MNDLSRTLEEWLFYLEHRHTQTVKLRLNHVRTVAEQLYIDVLPSKVITVAGTNGKGSTVRCLEALYCAADYRVGAYTSPHLFSFNERIRLDQEPIEDETLCRLFQTIEETPGGALLTYFEMATVAALLYFKQQAPDVVILEVGVGGRLDATNIIDADVAIITTVDFDHQDYLGDTLEAIGFEKAGIMRAGKPLVYGDISPPQSVLQQAERLQTPLFLYQQSYNIQLETNKVVFKSLHHDAIDLPVPALFLKSVAAALMATYCLNEHLPLTTAHWRDALKHVSILGRKQVFNGDVTRLFDVAHNVQAVTSLAHLMATIPCSGRVHAVFSGLKDKDLYNLIKPMAAYVSDWYCPKLEGERAAGVALLKTVFMQTIDHWPVFYSSPIEAYQAAMKNAQKGDLIVVYGSFLTVGPILAFVMNEPELGAKMTQTDSRTIC